MIEKGAISIGDVVRYNSLAVARVYANDEFMENVLMIDEAIRNDGFSVTESGTVGRLTVDNKIDDKVFIACGALVEGASQNRYSLFPALVMPNSHISLPVNCAEERQGLIGGSRGRYRTGDTIVMPSIRSGEVRQDVTWTRIMNTTVILNRMNPTRDYSHVEKTADIHDYIEAIGNPEDGQVGIVAGVRDGERTLFYTDFFGNHSILERVHAKLAKSFGIVARVHEGSADEVKKDDIINFLRKIEVAHGQKKPHVGGGNLYVLESPVKGSILAYENNTVQVSMRQDHHSN